MAENLNELIRKRGVLKSRVTRFETFINSISGGDTLTQLPARIEKFREYWAEFDKLQTSIEAFDDSDIQNEERENFENNYFKLISVAESHLNSSTGNSSSSLICNQISGGQHIDKNVKLPTMEIPLFHGSYKEWLEFHDTFNALINTNVKLTDIQKFYYLKNSLKGDAAEVIRALEVSEKNYVEAWKLLKNRFENKKLIALNHIDSMYNFPQIHKESFIQLRKLLDIINRDLRSLKSLGQPVESWDTLLIYILEQKLDAITKREWQKSVPSSEFPTLTEFQEFLEKRCQLLETLDSSKIVNKSSEPKNIRERHYGSKSYVAMTKTCVSCNENHLLFACKRFQGLSVSDRREEVKKTGVCWNCLKLGHRADSCTFGSCKQCGRKHNTMLHLSEPSSKNKEVHVTETQGYKCTGSLGSIETLLSTALVHIRDHAGRMQECRTLLDSGSQSNFMSRELWKKLRLPAQRVHIPVVGIGQGTTKISHSVKAKIQSKFRDFGLETGFLVIDSISDKLPGVQVDSTSITIPENVYLADAAFNQPNKIDLILGASIFWELICVGQIKLGSNKPILQKTKLGWVISGPIIGRHGQANISTCHFSSNSRIQEQLEKFWAIDELDQKKHLSMEERHCESVFLDTTMRDNQGRFIVNLHVRENISNLGDSVGTAKKRFQQLEKRLGRDIQTQHQYHEFIKEYVNLGHATRLGTLDEVAKQYYNNEHIYHLPHHVVFKATSSTTKCRVVFDGSAKTDTGISLNDVLMVGPKLQENLFNILLRFRRYDIVISGDVEKMYRQVLVAPEHRNLQRILWRFSIDEPIDVYQLNTITYGTAPASFLAVKCLQKLGLDSKEKFPQASQAILHDFYMDDLLLSTRSIQEAKVLREQISEILRGAGFILRKWVSNSKEVLSDETDNNLEIEHYLSNDPTTRALGLLWNSELDILRYRIQIDKNQARVTKRTILSVTSQIFDPLGLVGPAILRAKLIMQELWKLKVSWDESLPLGLHTSWLQFKKQIKSLEDLQIPRQTICKESKTIQLHCFSDASEVAYGAAIYIRSTDQNHHHHVQLICAKSRVAPVQTVNLPRLELCAALLTANLAREIIDTLQVTFDSVQFWSDSTIVLSWLSSEPCEWKTFVANRTAEIHQLTRGYQWNHVLSGDNPADVISRGMDTDMLKVCGLWWHGPKWLSCDESSWPDFHFTAPDIIPEVKVPRQIFKSYVNIDIFQRFSSLNKLQRVTAFCLRFAKNCIVPVTHRNFGNLTLEEMQRSLAILVRTAQNQEFTEEVHHLLKSKQIANSSALISLNPFIDDQGIMRLGGRLRHSDVSFDQKHPILLPSNHILTKQIILHEHYKHLHAGPQTLLSIIRLKYWPIGGRRTIRKYLHECLICFRVKPTPYKYLMGDLPRSRITPSRAFTNCGVDYAGPFNMKTNKLRGHKFVKGYLSVFVCFATKAVHLELVNELTTEAFMNCFKRFVARRGICSNIYSDNGTNFVGARNELQELFRFMRNPSTSSSFHEYFTQMSIKWHFIPAHSPHFGGLWEAAVRSAKYHLKRVIGNTNFTFDELHTVVTQIESCLNSRPLTPLSENPQDLDVLTPGHFLIGAPLVSLPQEDLSSQKTTRLKKYHQLTQMVQHFWSQWSRDYLSQLQQRGKWKTSPSNSVQLQLGTMVVIREDNLPPLKWQLGRVVQVHPGADDIVRVVSVLTSKGVIKRAAAKVCPLPFETAPKTN